MRVPHCSPGEVPARLPAPPWAAQEGSAGIGWLHAGQAWGQEAELVCAPGELPHSAAPLGSGSLVF